MNHIYISARFNKKWSLKGQKPCVNMNQWVISKERDEHVAYLKQHVSPLSFTEQFYNQKNFFFVKRSHTFVIAQRREVKLAPFAPVIWINMSHTSTPLFTKHLIFATKAFLITGLKLSKIRTELKWLKTRLS